MDPKHVFSEQAYILISGIFSTSILTLRQNPKTAKSYFGWIDNGVTIFQIHLFTDAFVEKYL